MRAPSGELLDKAKYAIDFYQREYAWQERQVRELIDDLTGKFLDFFDSRWVPIRTTCHGAALRVERHRSPRTAFRIAMTLSVLTHWQSAELVLFPQLTEAVVLQPRLQRSAVKPRELCLPCHTFSHEDILRSEVIQ